MSGEFESKLDALMVAHKKAVDAMAIMAAKLEEAQAADRRLFETCLAATSAALATLRTAIEEPSNDRGTD